MGKNLWKQRTTGSDAEHGNQLVSRPIGVQFAVGPQVLQSGTTRAR